MDTICKRTIELLPWLINGSLEAEERQPLLEHLAVCESCRHELAETADVWKLLTHHTPSLALAEYAHGLQASDLDRGSIERHLAVCPSCRQELEWMTAEAEVVDFEAARSARRPAPKRVETWRRLAIAAGIAAVVASGSLLPTFLRSSSVAPEPGAGRGAIVETTDLGGSQLGNDSRIERDLESSTGLFIDGFESGTTAWSSFSQ